MDCKHEAENITRIGWEYISNHCKTNETIYDSQFNKILKSGFVVNCKAHPTFIPTCILKLIQAKQEDSGRYICHVGEGHEAQFDSNMLMPIVEINLVVRGNIHVIQYCNIIL